MMNGTYPVEFSVAYPERPLDRLTSAFRLFVAIPILIVLGAVSGGGAWYTSNNGGGRTAAAGGLLFLGPLLLRFSNRVAVYLALMDDRYPSTDEQQAVHLEIPYPDAERLNRWLPLVKWLLAIPHYIVLLFLDIGVLVSVVVAWFAILFTGRYPRGLFDYVEGVYRWHNRVIGYALILVTDRYPPFSLQP